MKNKWQRKRDNLTLKSQNFVIDNFVCLFLNDAKERAGDMQTEIIKKLRVLGNGKLRYICCTVWLSMLGVIGMIMIIQGKKCQIFEGRLRFQKEHIN